MLVAVYDHCRITFNFYKENENIRPKDKSDYMKTCDLSLLIKNIEDLFVDSVILKMTVKLINR